MFDGHPNDNVVEIQDSTKKITSAIPLISLSELLLELILIRFHIG
jgi:hypothetical protein